MFLQDLFEKRGMTSENIDELLSLIQEGRIQLIGVIRLEILCGLRNETIFRTVNEKREAFADRSLDSEVCDRAARILYQCRARGFRGQTKN